MKILITLFLLLASSVVLAQTNMAGRVYHNSNVIAGKMNNITRDMNKELDKAKADAIMKAEEKKNANSQLPRRLIWRKRPRKE